MKRQGKDVLTIPSGRKRSYFTWNSQMDTLLSSTLFSQISEGNKGDVDFKTQAYQAVVEKLRNDLGVTVTVDNVKNRIKVWCKFRWDEERKMLVINIEDLKDWLEYCEGVPQASAYKNKCIENWNDICMLFASDRATGEGAEQHEESAAAMEIENEAGSTSETSSGESNKKLKKDRLADAVSSFAESFKDYVSKSKGPPRPTSKEIYDEVSNVLGLSRHQVLKAAKKFVNGTIDEFDMLKNLPEEQKLEWILLCIHEKHIDYTTSATDLLTRDVDGSKLAYFLLNKACDIRYREARDIEKLECMAAMNATTLE